VSFDEDVPPLLETADASVKDVRGHPHEYPLRAAAQSVVQTAADQIEVHLRVGVDLVIHADEKQVVLLADSDTMQETNRAIFTVDEEKARVPTLATGQRAKTFGRQRFELPVGAGEHSLVKLPRDIMPDLLHPNAKGYAIWAEAIEPTVKKLMGERLPSAGQS